MADDDPSDAMKPRTRGGSIWTPAQHRLWAEILEAEPELDPESAHLAEQHRMIARALELRAKKAH